jgi:hypothetical protein
MADSAAKILSGIIGFENRSAVGVLPSVGFAHLALVSDLLERSVLFRTERRNLERVL